MDKKWYLTADKREITSTACEYEMLAAQIEVDLAIKIATLPGLLSMFYRLHNIFLCKAWAHLCNCLFQTGNLDNITISFNAFEELFILDLHLNR